MGSTRIVRVPIFAAERQDIALIKGTAHQQDDHQNQAEIRQQGDLLCMVKVTMRMDTASSEWAGKKTGGTRHPRPVKMS